EPVDRVHGCAAVRVHLEVEVRAGGLTLVADDGDFGSAGKVRLMLIGGVPMEKL
ncbi:hypothetical protein HT105_23880, partial [Bacteroides fragilis]|nr:hypothetical protein [Bacteroides fragilis]